MNRPQGLDDRLLAAIERLSQAVATAARDGAHRAGLSPIQRAILARLAQGQPPVPEAAALAAELDVSQPTISEVLGTLLRKGYVERTTHASDRRRRPLVATAAGRAAAAAGAWEPQIRAALAPLPEDLREQGFAFLIALVGALCDQGALGVGRLCTRCAHFEPRDGPLHWCGVRCHELPESEMRVDCPQFAGVS